MAQSVKNLSAMQETREMSPDPIPGSERSLEEEMAIHSSILAWEIPQTEEPGVVGWGYSPWRCKELDMTE